jgi:hypothetical protein
MLTNNSYPTPLEQRSIGVQKKIRARIRELKKEGDLPVATVEERRALVLDLLAKNWGKGKIIEKSMG